MDTTLPNGSSDSRPQNVETRPLSPAPTETSDLNPPGPQFPRGRIGINSLLLLVVVYLALTQNFPFWRHVAETLPAGAYLANFSLLPCVFLALCVLQLLVVTPLSARAIVPPSLIVFLLIASLCSYFISTFAVLIVSAMIAHALQTDVSATGKT